MSLAGVAGCLEDEDGEAGDDGADPEPDDDGAGADADGDGANGDADDTGDDEADDDTGDDEYPNQPVEVIVPYSAGGGSDTYARQFASVMSDTLGVDFPVSNITGAGSMNGQREMATSEPDGYTVSVTVQPGNAIAYLSQGLDFGFEESRAVAAYVTDAMLLVSNPDVGVRNDYEELARMYREGELETVGIIPNSLMHAAGIKMNVEEEWDIEFERFVEYDGVAESFEGVASGEVPAAFTATSPAVSNIEDGELDPVVLFEETPVEADAVADTPTLQDLGYGDFGPLGGIWRGMLAPPETPDNVIETLEGAIEEAANSSEIQEWSEESGNPVEFIPHDEVEEMHQQAFQVYEDLDLDEHFN